MSSPCSALCKALLPQMKAGGSIINTGSIQSFDPSANLIAYASTKAAIVSFTRSLASLAIKQGVRVNAVSPWPCRDSPYSLHHAKREGNKNNSLPGRCSGEPPSLPSLLLFMSSWPATKPAMLRVKCTARPEVKCRSSTSEGISQNEKLLSRLVGNFSLDKFRQQRSAIPASRR